ncbi:GNAT family N-acetyltransferase [Liquorilactobacillus oeni]|uniref:Acetyltransferase n=1 Tax=Liquorilactobacillus oeni DSM 19972 TaxID=1423777 RepID=A0A0R1MB81_9LACO|nr:GNAT family N-acetyltransferase [Liquorilactobacillus oeni]KRL05392.1 acetyltransferase [Liquorilactobacillus oeni DSM 19972]
MPTIFIKQAHLRDVPAIVKLIGLGKKLLAADGIPQWQGNYPDPAIVKTDVQKGYTYLLLVDNQIAGAATLFQEEDPNYYKIYQGTWQKNPSSNKNYATIHRITINPQYHGQHLADFFFSGLFSAAYRLGFNEIRIDTHETNKRMQHLIKKSGFSYSGIVYMNDDSKDQRNVYQLFLK